MGLMYLLDAAVTETNAIRLRFLDGDGKIREFTDSEYRPYFLTTYPLTDEDKTVMDYYNGNVQTVERTDLFSGEKRLLGKVSWPNVRIASKAAGKFRFSWESEVDFTRSYVYDKGLVFGALHSENDLRPVLDVPDVMKERFESTFGEVKQSDPSKYTQIFHWFCLLNQPVPNLNQGFFGAEQVDVERAYAAWMLSRIANLPVTESLNNRRVSDWLKSILYTYLRKNGFLIPTSEELRRGKPTHVVTGALTVPPKAGAYFNTVVCDFESLYASCIDSFNLSYETVDCGHEGCLTNRIPDFDGHVCTRRRGFYAVLVGALKELRIRLFKPASKDKTLTDEERKIASAAAKLLKLILVSSYGVTVRIHGLACPPLAEGITGYGRYVLRESWRMAEESGIRPLYGDTDSLFLDNASDEQIDWLIKAVKGRFRLDLAVDKRYTMCVLPKSKKAYFGIFPDGTPDIKGVTAIKSNSPKYINDVFQQCVKELSTVRNQEEYVRSKIGIRKIVHRNMARLRNRRVPLQDLSYSVKLYFDPNEKMEGTKMMHQPYQCECSSLTRE